MTNGMKYWVPGLAGFPIGSGIYRLFESDGALGIALICIGAALFILHARISPQ